MVSPAAPRSPIGTVVPPFDATNFCSKGKGQSPPGSVLQRQSIAFIKERSSPAQQLEISLESSKNSLPIIRNLALARTGRSQGKYLRVSPFVVVSAMRIVKSGSHDGALLEVSTILLDLA